MIPDRTLAFTAVAAGLIAAPGADFAAVARNAIADRRAGVCTGLGVATGSLVHTAAAVAGVAAVFVAHRSLFTALQVAGGVYLLYLGARSLLTFMRDRVDPAAEKTAARGPAAAFRQGFLVNVTNPKAPVLFLSLLPQFVPPDADPLTRSLVLSLIVVGCALLWFPAVALAVHSVGALLGGRPVRRTLALLTSLLLLGLGVRMLLFG
ncbi:LysE family translocator [Actinoallomurus oryzae]|uniref:LysE family translocator n=1 Tax=Actinoallomurus oryzae TaxID=502180 RepID=A0ABP8QR54_9ACTN